MTQPFVIQTFVDAQPVRAIHVRILIICSLALFIDGFDVFVLGKVAPAIAAGFGLPPQAMTTVILMQQIGLASGAFLAAPLADRFGRQRMTLVCTGAFALLTLLATNARSLHELAVLRGLAGIFLAGMLPMAVSLIAECTPRAHRALFIAITMAAYTMGSAAGGMVAAWGIDRWGWESTFWIGGGLPLLLLPAIAFLLPESLHFLSNRAVPVERLLRTLRRFDPGLQLSSGTVVRTGDGSSAAGGRVPALALFAPARRMTTLLMRGCTFLLGMGSIALLAAWLPSFFLAMQGIPIQQFAVFAMIGVVGSLAGTLGAGWLLDRLSPKLLGPAAYLGLAMALLGLGHVQFGTAAFIACVIAWNFFQSSGQALLNILMTRLYLVSLRSTGMGWAGGAGRLGGVVLPLYGGFALSAGWQLGTTLMIAGLGAGRGRTGAVGAGSNGANFRRWTDS